MKNIRQPNSWAIDDFRILSRVGKGKFGEVSVAQEIHSEFVVALKKMIKLEVEENQFS